MVEQHTLLSDNLLFKINKTKNGIVVKLSLTDELISITLPWLRISEIVLRKIQAYPSILRICDSSIAELMMCTDIQSKQ